MLFENKGYSKIIRLLRNVNEDSCIIIMIIMTSPTAQFRSIVLKYANLGQNWKRNSAATTWGNKTKCTED